MSTNYTGSPTATQSPAAAPGPGVAPIVSLPVDAVDDMTAASLYQALKVSADYIAFIQSAVNLSRPTASNDVPMVSVSDSAGNRRFNIDHLGLPAGYQSKLHEPWMAAQVTAVATPASGTRFTDTMFKFFGNATGTYTLRDSASFTTQELYLENAVASGSHMGLITVAPVIYASANAVCVAEFAGFAADTDAHTDFTVGFSSVQSTSFDTVANLVAFRKTAASANWFCFAAGGAGVDSGVGANAGTGAKRIEYTGANTPQGLKARFFIGGVLVASITPTVSPAYFGCYMRTNSLGTNFANTLLSPVSITRAMFLNSPAV